MEYPFKDLLPLDEVLAREGYYKDWTHLDPEVFYSLTQISEYIKTKGYGVDVRLLIAQLAEHFGLKTTQVVDLGNLIQAEHATLKQQVQQAVAQVNADRNALETQFNQSVAQMQAEKDAVIANATVDSEVILARGGKPTLGARLDDTTAQLEQTATDLIQRAINVKSFGAKGDYDSTSKVGTDDSLSIQTAIDSITTGTIFVPSGLFLTTQDLIIPHGVSFIMDANAKIVYRGTGTAITVDSAKNCDYVFNVEKENLEWKTTDTSSIGILLKNCDNCDIKIIGCYKFNIGFRLGGFGDGCCYNNIKIQFIRNNKVNLDVYQEIVDGVLGWSNSNNFYGGSIRIDSNNGGVAGTKLINLVGNGCSFYGVTLEGAAQEKTIYCTASHNIFVNCRYEQVPDGSIEFADTSRSNFIIGGYGLNDYDDLKIIDNGIANTFIVPTSKKIFAREKTGLIIKQLNSNSKPVFETQGIEGNTYLRMLGSGKIELYDASGYDGSNFPSISFDASNSSINTGKIDNTTPATPWLRAYVSDYPKIIKDTLWEGGRRLDTIYTLEENSKNPSISSGHVFKTNNNVATSIIDFGGAVSGERLTILAKDENTTITHNPIRIFLKSGTNETLSAEQIISFINIDGVWYED